MRSLLFTAAAGLLAAPLGATPTDLRSLAAMKGHARVLLVFAPSMRDPRLERQRQVMARYAAGAAERDLAFVQVADGVVIGARDKAEALRRHYATPKPRYRTLLIGKDGNVAQDTAGPLDGRQLSGAIDGMPMRQDEVRRARAGLGRPRT